MNRVDETNHRDFPKRTRHAKAILTKFNIPVPEPLMFVKGMQFAVPRQMIVNKPYAMWRDLYLHFMGHAHNAWFYEMIWPTIFEYEHRD
jgi:alpha-D-ribose 1-methylphosphonate 5-phosphate C-P lyase